VPFVPYHTMFSGRTLETHSTQQPSRSAEAVPCINIYQLYGASMYHWVQSFGRSVYNSMLMLEARGSAEQGVISCQETDQSG